MRNVFLSLVLLIVFSFANLVKGVPFKGVNLKCEHSVKPTGIDIPIPRLSWNITSERRNWNQSAYQILVSSDSSKLSLNGGDMWNSGKIASSDCIYVPFKGKPLFSLQKYWWKGKTEIETGSGNYSFTVKMNH